MPVTVGDAERELAEAKVELEKVQNQIQRLAAREGELSKVVNGWQAIIAAKRKQSGDTAPASGPGNGGIQIAVADTILLESDPGENKTQFVRSQIRANATSGVSVAELKRAAASIGMEHPPSWPYGPLARLKSNGEIAKRRGRFYPVQPKSSGGEQDARPN